MKQNDFYYNNNYLFESAYKTKKVQANNAIKWANE